MSKKYITIKTMNTKSIERAIAEVHGMIEYTEDKVLEISERLARRGEEIARELYSQYTDGTGELANSVKSEVIYKNGKFKTRIWADAEHAAYVEFGTGIVGAGLPNKNGVSFDTHPRLKQRKYKHDVNSHGEDGWVYEKDGKFYWTQGQPSNPVMYETLQILKEEYPQIIREVFSH